MYVLLAEQSLGALSPMLIVLATMMMMGGGSGGGSSSYSFGGKHDDVPFLLVKARAAARKIPCPHRRIVGGVGGIIGGAAINYADFFDLSAKPADISQQAWDDMSRTAFDAILGFVHNPRLHAVVKGCNGDGALLLAKLKAIGGSKRQQIKTTDTTP